MTTMVVWLVLDRLHVGELGQGIVWTLMALWWVGAILQVTEQNQVPLPGFGEDSK